VAAPKPPSRYHHGDLERALIDAAIAAIAEQGAERVNLRELARAVGVSPSAPYRHFADKDALMTAVARELASRYGELLARASAEASADTLAQFRATGVATVRFAARYPAHFRVACSGGLLATPSEDAATRVALQAAQAAGAVAPLPVDDLLLTAHCTIYGLARLIADGQLPGGRVTAERADSLANAVTEVLGFGLLPRR
jgi:AcrR family transcriptional regulator